MGSSGNEFLLAMIIGNETAVAVFDFIVNWFRLVGVEGVLDVEEANLVDVPLP